METIYFIIVVFLLSLAVFGLFVGVSNDAVNFLQSAVGARAAKFRTVLIYASLGVLLGAVMSTGMMDVARHGILTPVHYSFFEVMTIFFAVMVANVIILDMFNSVGMPTSSTISLVFGLLGASFSIATLKTIVNPSLDYNMLLNSGQALSMIIAIFVSVAFAFVFGWLIMWISRMVFTFNYKKHSRYSIAIFGGIAFTALSYFIFLKGVGNSPYMDAGIRTWINGNIQLLLLITFGCSTVFMEILHLFKVNIFRVIVLMGTFALAMAFAGNDLVNFIGVPLSGLDSYQDYVAHANGAAPNAFMMSSLMENAKTSPLYLLIAGVIMVVAMVTSKKAQNVIKTSVDLSRQDGGDEMFGSSSAARAIVRFFQTTNKQISAIIPANIKHWIDSRFDKNGIILEDETAAFDLVRAAVTLVISSMLITIGTNYKLPLSTTYVTFMVAMGSSLADRAWSRESAVFRVTGVISVIGGWFITAGASFLLAAVICLVMYYGGIVANIAFIVLVIASLIRSSRKYKEKKATENRDKDVFRLMMRTRDPQLVWEMLQKQVRRTQSDYCKFALEQFNLIIDGLENEKTSSLRKAQRDLVAAKQPLKKVRRQEMLVLQRVPRMIAIERNTWFHLGMNSNQQLIYGLRRMLEPIKEHVDNSFNPLSPELIADFLPIKRSINELMKASCAQIETGRYENYRQILADADNVKDELSILRKRQIDRMQDSETNSQMQVNLLYLNVLQESQQLLSNMRHQLRAAKKFME
ncbi:inorganic phosphate transporter [Segatella bryantii]|uniref:inorganic phosphate transporter n=1 Tax=Segatella bryantii TaxID=77095 RepID=UPI001EDA1996|nr:inorganic phosphate transporter [Segatella bryantii]UKK72589.1 inorganic phosphate transporter [Segatella bryantii]